MVATAAMGFLLFRHVMRNPPPEGKRRSPMNAVQRRGAPARDQAGRDPVRVTALLYLQEALLKERYEECREILSIAREFGADETEIRTLLENPKGALYFLKRK